MNSHRKPKKLDNTPVMGNDLWGTTTGLAPWAPNTSPSRLYMLASQMQQKLITKGINRPRFFTGQEKEYAKYTFGCKTKFPAKVIAVINKFETGRGRGSFRYNPEKVVIVQNMDTGEYDYLEYKTYCSNHTSFGFNFDVVQENQHYLQKDQIIPEDTYLTRSPGVTPDGAYIWGTRTKTAFISHHAVTEDGFLVSDEWCEENRTTGFGEITIMVDPGKYLINANGDKNHYQPLPLPGEAIRKDGLIAACREYDKILGAVELTDEGMANYNYHFDEKYFIEAGVENARCVNVEIWKSDGERIHHLPTFMNEEFGESTAVDRLWDAHLKYLQAIKKVYHEIEKAHPKFKPLISKPLHRLFTDALVVCGAQEGKRKFRNKNSSIATLEIKVTYMYDIVPDIGFKLTNMYGFKGVICAKKPRVKMPRYPGTDIIADLVGDGLSVINRMNPSIFIEQYCNYQAEKLEREFKARLLQDKSDASYESIWEDLTKFYRAVVPKYMDVIESQNWNKKRIHKHIDGVAFDQMYGWMPSDTPNLGIKQIDDLLKVFPVSHSFVEWISDKGDLVQSDSPVVIGEMYVMLLEKTGHDWGAVDVAKRQVHGVPTKLSGRERFNNPFRKTSFRFFGEAEIRNYSGIVGGYWAADMLDRANNPKAQEAIWSNIISSPHPTRIEKSLDRNEIPLGKGLAISYLNNAMYVSGAEFRYMDVDNLTHEQEVQIDRVTKRRIEMGTYLNTPEEEEEEAEEFIDDTPDLDEEIEETEDNDEEADKD